ncbi:RNA polymerase I-specific transcription initiation factor RRN3 [Taenia solium]|eukprot:TsM_000028700 transcript=TsM_000028700 gene=TsM_000028700
MGHKPDDLSQAISEYLRGETRKVDFLINRLTLSDESSTDVETFMDDCLRLSYQFPEDLADIICDVLLQSKPWYSFNLNTSNTCLLFLVNMATRFDNFAQRLLSHFCNIICSPLSYQPSNSDVDIVELIFSGLREFFASMPQFEGFFIDCLCRKIPGWGIPAPQLFLALASVLRLCYDPPCLFSDASTQQLLCVCFNLLSDIEINTESIALFSSETELLFSKLNDPFNPDEIEKNEKIIYESLTDEVPSSAPVFWLLAVGLLKIFPKRKESTLDKDAKKREWSRMCAVFRSLRTRFLHFVLPIQSDFVVYPLLLIFMSSLRPGLVVNLVEKLWAFVVDTRQPDEVRTRCMRHLADYLARSRHCTMEVVIEQMHDLAAWCVEYTYFRRGRLSSHLEVMLREHTLFYTVFESIIYILTYRQAELIGTPNGRHSCADLPLVQLINCPFKPLAALESSLRSHFQTLSFAYKLSWIATMTPECPTEMDSPPKPSFDCPLSHALASLAVASRMHLVNDFIPAKRTFKRPLENGDARSCSSIPSSDEHSEDQSTSKGATSSKPRHFNFNALLDLT